MRFCSAMKQLPDTSYHQIYWIAQYRMAAAHTNVDLRNMPIKGWPREYYAALRTKTFSMRKKHQGGHTKQPITKPHWMEILCLECYSQLNPISFVFHVWTQIEEPISACFLGGSSLKKCGSKREFPVYRINSNVLFLIIAPPPFFPIREKKWGTKILKKMKYR